MVSIKSTTLCSHLLVLCLQGFLPLYFPFTLHGQVTRTPGSAPVEWSQLNKYQYCISRETFERRVNELYSRDGEFWKYAEITDNLLTLYRDSGQTIPVWTLYFTQPDEESLPQPRWSPTLATEELPLRGLVVCLDPGHIGGEWARTEQRWFKIRDDPPIIEWDLNIITARHIEQLLTELGAKVVWTKTQPVPLTTERPDTLRPIAFLSLWHQHSESTHKRNTDLFRTTHLKDLNQLLTAESERIFYRLFEISARAEVVRQLRPDITLAIHFNAAPWTDPENANLVTTNHLVIFIHGSYTADELKLEDHRFHLVRKVLENTSAIELGVAEEIARQYARIWPQWRPANYGAPPWAMPLMESPYIYARNLLANRIYVGPVVFVEGPLMNAADSYPRLLAGDYEGKKLINGKWYRSIFREFAEAVAEGVKEYYIRGAFLDPPLPSLIDNPP